MPKIQVKIEARIEADFSADSSSDNSSFTPHGKADDRIMCFIFGYQLISSRRYLRVSLWNSSEIAYWFTSDTSPLCQYRSFFKIDVKSVRVARLFYLQDTLRPEAEKLKTFFSTNNTVDPARIELLTFSDLTALMDPDDSSSQPYSDVVIILGHSNVFSFGSLAISDILSAFVHPEPPSFVVFLGCCSGNPRYGPLKMVSLLPEWENTIFGFFQRRIYKDELCDTVLGLAIKHYLHLDVPIFISKAKEKSFVSYSISCAYSDRFQDDSCDSTCFFNPEDKLSPAQELLGIIKNITVIDGIIISPKEIPWSCWQLAMYHDFTNEKQDMRNFIATIKRELKSIESGCSSTEEVKKKIIVELDEICQEELKHRKLYKLIELACEMYLTRVTAETFKLLRSNEWEKVDHLQFFAAMIHGYWGKNDRNDLRELGKFHLKEMMKLGPSKLHNYQLCCVGFCLFSPEAYIVFPDRVNHLTEIWGFFVQVHQIIIPHDEYSIKVQPLPTNDGQLPWHYFFEFCTTDDRFDEVYKRKKRYYSMHSYLKDECISCTDRKQCEYRYTYDDLEKALRALKDFFFPSSIPLSKYYDVRTFKNEDNEDCGYMKCFPLGIKYCEMRVIQDPYKTRSTTLATHQQWKKVSRCRFVFEYYPRATIIGTLYFTDSHYGEDKVKRETLVKKLKDKSKGMNYFQMFEKLTKRKKDKYDLQKELLEEKHGTLLQELKKAINDNLCMFTDSGRLYNMNLGVSHNHLVDVSQIVNSSISHLQNELAKKDLKGFLDSLSELDVKFVNIFTTNFKVKDQHWSMESLQNTLGKKVQKAVKTVKDKLFNEGFYPFVKIGTLTIPRHRTPLLEPPSSS